MEMVEGEPPYMELPPLRVISLVYKSLKQKALFLITTKGIPPLKDTAKWSHDLNDFLGLCLQPQPDLRPDAHTMLQVYTDLKCNFNYSSTIL